MFAEHPQALLKGKFGYETPAQCLKEWDRESTTDG
jgi:hypothetical protein